MNNSDRSVGLAKRPRSDAASAAALARALDPYGLGPELGRESDLVVVDLAWLIAVAEGYGLRPARAARWRRLLLTTVHSPDLLARCERRLRGWLLDRLEPTGR